MGPEQEAREIIDWLLAGGGWAVQDFKAADIHGVAIREFVLEAGQGFADYLLYIDGKAAGVIEAKKVGATRAQFLDREAKGRLRTRVKLSAGLSSCPKCAPHHYGDPHGARTAYQTLARSIPL